MRGVDTMFLLLGVIATSLMLPVSAQLRRQVEEAQSQVQVQTSNNNSDSMGTLLLNSSSLLTNRVIPSSLLFTPNILGGSDTLAGEYPYFATALNTVCGATLIHPDILLTAGHCQTYFGTIGVVYVGAHQTDTLQTAAVQRTIIRQYLHPDNDLKPFKSDLMLFQLNAPVYTLPTVTLNADPALPLPNATLTVIGFGTTHSKYVVPTDTLLAVDVYPVNDDTCVRQYEGSTNTIVTPDTMLCAGHPTLPDRDSCRGDSGGPLLDKGTGNQVGIVSFGKGCGQPEFPGVYTRVSTYASWIRDRICELSAVPPSDCPPRHGDDGDPTATAAATTPNSTISTTMNTNTNSNSNSNTNYSATEEALTKVLLEIQYDSRSAESFWRLDDVRTGTTVAFQPSIPERGSFDSHELLLPNGKYRLVMTDTSGDGICCFWGLGNVTVSAAVVVEDNTAETETTNVAVEARMTSPDDATSNFEVLGESDGKFGFHLSLAFVVGDPILDEYSGTAASNNQVNLVVMLVAVVLSVTVLW